MPETFGQALQRVRKQKGMTQRKLAFIVGCSVTALSLYERDEVDPSLKTASSIAKALNVSLDSLLGEKKNESIWSTWSK